MSSAALAVSAIRYKAACTFAARSRSTSRASSSSIRARAASSSVDADRLVTRLVGLLGLEERGTADAGHLGIATRQRRTCGGYCAVSPLRRSTALAEPARRG